MKIDAPACHTQSETAECDTYPKRSEKVEIQVQYKYCTISRGVRGKRMPMETWNIMLRACPQTGLFPVVLRLSRHRSVDNPVRPRPFLSTVTNEATLRRGLFDVSLTAQISATIEHKMNVKKIKWPK
jgi:hypothetical protein